VSGLYQVRARDLIRFLSMWHENREASELVVFGGMYLPARPVGVCWVNSGPARMVASIGRVAFADASSRHFWVDFDLDLVAILLLIWLEICDGALHRTARSPKSQSIS
jgi:hypothetical protein